MYNELNGTVTKLNEKLKNLVVTLAFKGMNWKIKIMQGDREGANENIHDIEKILEQMKLYLSSFTIH
jgi:hypothetical protein